MYDFVGVFYFIGKLKPFGENCDKTEGNISQSHQKKYKQHQVETRYILTEL